MSIHSTHPFADPTRDAARQFRGRLPAPVTLWASGAGRRRAGLTVSSVDLAYGEPPRLIGLLDPLASVLETIDETGCWVVGVLTASERALADVFAGLAPAPGGAFSRGPWEQTEWGPRPAAVGTWAGVRLERVDAVGASALVVGAIEHLAISDDAPLVHLRGRSGPWTSQG